MLEDNWVTVEVFRHCQPTWITGMQGAMYAGIAATEIEAACRLLQVLPGETVIVSAGVKFMASVTAEEYQKKR